MSLPIYICPYKRGKDLHGSAKPYHWAFFIVSNPTTTESIVHQLHGMPGGFYYNEAESAPRLGELGEGATGANGVQLEIGAIPADRLGEVEELLRKIPVVVDEASEWNCQSWSLAAVEVLSHWLWYDGPTIGGWLKEEDE